MSENKNNCGEPISLLAARSQDQCNYCEDQHGNPIDWSKMKFVEYKDKPGRGIFVHADAPHLPVTLAMAGMASGKSLSFVFIDEMSEFDEKAFQQLLLKDKPSFEQMALGLAYDKLKAEDLRTHQPKQIDVPIGDTKNRAQRRAEAKRAKEYIQRTGKRFR